MSEPNYETTVSNSKDQARYEQIRKMNNILLKRQLQCEAVRTNKSHDIVEDSFSKEFLQGLDIDKG